jgi:hypothetical protein
MIFQLASLLAKNLDSAQNPTLQLKARNRLLTSTIPATGKKKATISRSPATPRGF